MTHDYCILVCQDLVHSCCCYCFCEIATVKAIVLIFVVAFLKTEKMRGFTPRLDHARHPNLGTTGVYVMIHGKA